MAWLDDHLRPQVAAPAIVSMTVEQWSGAWYSTYVEPVRPPNTARSYLYALAKLEPIWTVDVRSVRPSQLQAIVGALAKALEPATVCAIAGVWRRCFDAAVDDELIVRNPARRMVLPTISARPAARHVTPEEAAILRTAIVGQRFEAAYALALGCGLRMGEILGLHWEHVDFERGRAWIQHQYTNNHWRDTPKARNPHWIPLPPFVIAALLRHRGRQPAGAILVMQSPYRGAVSRKHGKPTPWSQRVVTADLAALVAGLKLPHLTSHAARHGIASVLFNQGAPATVIAERLGNTPAIILNTYSHAGAEGRERAAEIVDAYLGDDAGTDSAASGRH